MIVIDRRDDPLFVMRMEGNATPEDLYMYRHLREELEMRQCAYAMVWIDDAERSLCLHQQTGQLPIPEHDTQKTASQRLSIWALLRMLSA